ncbi:MAG: UDP-3-O-acyl-N-acetylglucosamine deacetylase [Synergistaceae bacterium]|nr:UDP-3-O-acyl-N-acetylglucosamine deacetylase [Synergistaceae bacterium]MBQ7169765.1 UDP-3-O-acyl-N-acetylglucosamine deacetylase [Synergistaceae bacterium]
MRLNGKISLEGAGLHSGKICRLTIEPYNSPYVVMRSGNEQAPLYTLKSSGTNRGSDYTFPGGTVIRTCEHVLSSLAGMGIYSGVLVTVDGGEMPGLDGCAMALCSEIMSHAVDDGYTIPCKDILRPVIVSSEDRTRFVAAFPADEFHVTYTVEYDTVGTQIYDYTQTPRRYITEIAPARTFAYERDIEYLRSHGMALGGSLDNAILIGGSIQAKGGLRWPDEFVRHKVLDLIGDLSSVGRPLNAHIIAVRAGHELHLRLADKLKEEMQSWQR